MQRPAQGQGRSWCAEQMCVFISLFKPGMKWVASLSTSPWVVLNFHINPETPTCKHGAEGASQCRVWLLSPMTHPCWCLMRCYSSLWFGATFKADGGENCTFSLLVGEKCKYLCDCTARSLRTNRKSSNWKSIGSSHKSCCSICGGVSMSPMLKDEMTAAKISDVKNMLLFVCVHRIFHQTFCALDNIMTTKTWGASLK